MAKRFAMSYKPTESSRYLTEYIRMRERLGRTMAGMAGLAIINEAIRPDRNIKEKINAISPYVDDFGQYVNMAGKESDLNSVYRLLDSVAGDALKTSDGESRAKVFEQAIKGMRKAAACKAVAAMLEEAAKQDVDAQEKLRNMEKYLDVFAEPMDLETRDFSPVFQTLGADISMAELLYKEPARRPADVHGVSRKEPKYVSVSFVINSVKNPTHPYEELRKRLLSDPKAEELLDISKSGKRVSVAKENVPKIKTLLMGYRGLGSEKNKSQKTREKTSRIQSKGKYKEYEPLYKILGGMRREGITYRKLKEWLMSTPEAKYLLDISPSGKVVRVANENVPKVKMLLKWYGAEESGDRREEASNIPPTQNEEPDFINLSTVVLRSKGSMDFRTTMQKVSADPNAKRYLVKRGQGFSVRTGNFESVRKIIRGYRTSMSGSEETLST